jgi:hypothetical protein
VVVGVGPVHTGVVVSTVLNAAVGAIVVGAGLWSAGSLLRWGGHVNEGQVGGHVWAGTSALGAHCRGVGGGMVLMGAVGLGPLLWVVVAVD